MTDTSDMLQIVGQLQEIAPAGFAMAFHIRFTTPSLLLQSYPKDWIAHYSQNGLVMQDPTVHWGFENTGMIDWSNLADNDPAQVIKQAAAHGMNFGVTYAANRSDSLTVSSFARTDQAFTTAEREAIESGVNAIHDATLSVDGLDAGLLEDLKNMSILTTVS